MKNICDWINEGKEKARILEDYDYPIDNSYIAGMIGANQDYSNDILHNVTCPSDYSKWVPKALNYALLNWNHAVAAAKDDRSLDIKKLQTSTLGVISSAWYVLFEAYRGWGAEWAAKKGKSFITEFSKEVATISNAWMKVKAGKPV